MFRVIPVDEDACALLRGQNVDVADAGPPVGCDGIAHQAQSLTERGRRLPVEQVGAVLDGERCGVVGVFGQHHAEVEHRRGGRGLVPVGREAEQSGVVVASAVVGDEDVEQRVAAGNPRRVEGFDDAVEGQVGVGERVEIVGADASEQFGEGGVARDIGAQHHGVDEQAHHVIEDVVVAAGDRGSDHDVGACTQTAQQDRHRGVQYGEHAGVMCCRQVAQREGGIGAQLYGDTAAGA
ncbi:hypothetical protein MOBUDSM44075_04231 [Mycolicibacterium obuense]|uniref:Uncharacterized protein n=1 Tax=Mycolicibacterium obuense TaxID=1807 RepID=A0A0J6YEF0_9MYCO|nr:hypothetical protein MOBUDSM44075_04231 [Mycolicibacterium obuense]